MGRNIVQLKAGNYFRVVVVTVDFEFCSFFSKILNSPAVSLWDFHSWDALVPSLGTTNIDISLRFIVWTIS